MSQHYGARVVIRLSNEFARAVNADGLAYTQDQALALLKQTLAAQKAELHNQLRDFEYYVESSEAHGITDTPMVNWTRDATRDPRAQARYSTMFAVAVAGRKVFDAETAEKLAAHFQHLVGAGVVEQVKVDSMDPAKNPPVPSRYFK